MALVNGAPPYAVRRIHAPRARKPSSQTRTLQAALLVTLLGCGPSGRATLTALSSARDAAAAPNREAGPQPDVPDAGTDPNVEAGAGAGGDGNAPPPVTICRPAPVVDEAALAGSEDDLEIYLRNVATGLTTELVRRNGVSIAEAGHLSHPPQRWRLERSPPGANIGKYALRSVAASELCLRPLPATDAGAAPAVGALPCEGRHEWTLASAAGAAFTLRNEAGQLLAAGGDDALVGRALTLVMADSARSRFTLVDSRFRAGGIAGDCTDPRLDELTFLTAHNAFHTTGEGGKILPNQTRSVVQQLADGVRGFQLDIYEHDRTVYTCHGTCQVTGLRALPLRAHLETFVKFLDDNPNEIVTLFLEDYVERPETLCQIIDATPGLSRLRFDPEANDVRARGWPRRSELRSKNQRLLIFSQRDGRGACGVAHDRKWTTENFWTLGLPTEEPPDLSCTARWAEQPLASCGKEGLFRPLFVMNHYRSGAILTLCPSDNGARLRQRTMEICPQAAHRKPNFLAVDCYDVGDARALVADLNRCDPAACGCPR